MNARDLIAERLTHIDAVLSDAEDAIDAAGHDLTGNTMAHPMANVTDRTDRAAAARRTANELARQAIDIAFHAGELAGLARAADWVENDGAEGDETDTAEREGPDDG